MSIKSLRKAEKAKRSQQTKFAHNLHLVKGEHKHNITHSHTPISADEIERIEKINPEYVSQLFNLLDKSLEIEKHDREMFYSAIDKEQENEKLSTIKQSEDNQKSMKFAGFTIAVFLTTSLIFASIGETIIAGGIITVGLLGVIKAIFTKK